MSAKRALLALVFLLTVLDNPFTAPFNGWAPLTETLGQYWYANIKTWSGVPLPFSLFEWLPALLAAAAWRRRNAEPPARRELPRLALLFFAVVGLGALRGALFSGGDPSAIYWALKGPVVIPFLTYAGYQLLRTERDFRALAATLLAGVTCKACQGLYYFYVVLGGERGKTEYVTTHAGSYVMSIALLCVLMLYLLPQGASRLVSNRARLVATLCAVPIATVFVLNHRRVELVGLSLSVLVAFVLASLVHPRRMLRAAVVALPLAALYAAVGGQLGGILGAPHRMVESLLDNQNASNVYRQIENYDLVQTILRDPLLGRGIGLPFDEALKLVDISSLYTFYLVNPHNSILWLWECFGLVGMAAFGAWLGMHVLHGVRCFFARGVSEAERAILLVAVANILRFLTFAYGDMLFYNSEGCFLLALSLAAVHRVCRLVDHKAQAGELGQDLRRVRQRPTLPRPAVIQALRAPHVAEEAGS